MEGERRIARVASGLSEDVEERLERVEQAGMGGELDQRLVQQGGHLRWVRRGRTEREGEEGEMASLFCAEGDSI